MDDSGNRDPDDAPNRAGSGGPDGGETERVLRELRGIARDAETGSTEDLFAYRRREAALEEARERRCLHEGAKPRRVQQDATSLSVPDDAGAYEDRLREVLLRIPERWGRRIRVDKGWYPLVCDLNDALAELLPSYELHQVKQKFGVLNYNWEDTSEPLFTDPNDPKPDAVSWEQYQAELAVWHERQAVFRERTGRTEEYADLQQRVEAANALVSEAEERSMTICELCGAPGEPSHRDEEAPWTLILCDDCRAVPINGATYLTSASWEQKYGAPKNRGWLLRAAGE